MTRGGGGGGSEWLDGKCTGNGTTTFKSGSRYVGVYHEDKMNGHGARRAASEAAAAAAAAAVAGLFPAGCRPYGRRDAPLRLGLRRGVSPPLEAGRRAGGL